MAYEYTGYSAIKFERRGHILVVTLDNPPMNAVAPALHTDLARVFREIDNDEDARAVILTGSGKVFSAGGDIKAMVRRLDEEPFNVRLLTEVSQIVHGLVNLRKPVIARVNGHAMGLGCTMALLCDIVIAVDTAKFGDAHVKVGLAAGDGAALIWPQLIGFARAKEYLLTGEPLSAVTAAQIGLINYAVPAAELDARVDSFATRFAEGAPLAISATKQAVNLLLRQQASTITEAHLSLQTQTKYSADHREAIFALHENRKPVFTGK